MWTKNTRGYRTQIPSAHMKRSFATGIVAIAVAIMSCRANGQTDDIKSMSPPERLAFVLAKVQKRESTLANFEYQLTEITQKVDVHSGAIIQTFDGTQYMTLRRKDGTLWTHAYKYREEGKPELTTITNWDGNRSRGYSLEHTDKQRLGGSISASESEIFPSTRYNNILGLRALGAGGPCLLSQWAEKKLKTPDVTVSVELGDVDGKPMVGLRAVGSRIGTDDGGTATFWLDPDRGFMIARFESTNGRTNVNGGTNVTHTVKEAKRVDAVWVPIKAVCAVHRLENDWRTEQVYEVSSFKLNTVKDDDVKIVFPLGCEVADRILNVTWKVTPGGLEFERTKDPKTGQIFDPASPSAARIIDEALKNSGLPDPALLPPRNPAP
jgi:hypothetical protein